MASKIEDYGLIGNMRTCALVSRSGDIDWLCAPRFDSDACFASLIGYDEHGRWSLRPTAAIRETRHRYRGDTLILETEITCDGGKVRIIDFMPVENGECDIARIVEGVEGSVQLELLVEVRFGYGASKSWVEPVTHGLRFTAGPDSVVLRAPVELNVDQRGRANALLNIRKGDRVPLQFGYRASYEAAPVERDVEAELRATESFWRMWSSRCTYEGDSRDAVMRSLLTLKALNYAPTGGIVAAPTTSLPEAIGGERNWDYRFCWLRDSSLTIDALLIGGYTEEAAAFRNWLLRAVAGDPADMQIMYDIAGARRLTEFELTWLPGYEGSRPVHAGNAASGQFQLDVYGEVISCLYAGLERGIASGEHLEPLAATLAFLEQAWQRPDDGIWEVRGGRRHFTHSKVMAWVAFDRAIRAIRDHGMGGDRGKAMLPHLSALRERIHAEVCQRGFHPRLNSFTQSYGGEALDASLLLLPHTGFLPASDPRVQGTVAAIERDLLRDGFVLRYDTAEANDGLKGSEGAFLACSFWLADNYAYAGRMREAEELFQRLLSIRNPLGLLAEEYDPRLQRQVGNFPQGFSHLALIWTADVIDRMKSKRTKAKAA